MRDTTRFLVPALFVLAFGDCGRASPAGRDAATDAAAVKEVDTATAGETTARDADMTAASDADAADAREVETATAKDADMTAASDADAAAAKDTQPGKPALLLDKAPELCSTAPATGKLVNLDPKQHKIAAYIYMDGWWTKPSWDAPLTPISESGAWTVNLNTHPNDVAATKLAFFAWPDALGMPPLGKGEAALPAALFSSSPAYLVVDKKVRKLQFSGAEWYVKGSCGAQVSPGPCAFSDAPEDVWVDAEGKLHLTMKHKGDKWFCTEVYSAASFGYGKYRWFVGSDVGPLDKEVVAGLFTYSHDLAFAHREMDIEFSRWGDAANQNAQYVVQPFATPGHVERFDMPSAQHSTHTLSWCADKVMFRSATGWEGMEAVTPVHSWVFDIVADIPQPGDENVRVNLYGAAGKPPSDGKDVEVLIHQFDFTPCCPGCE